MNNIFKNKSVLITGGTGTIGRILVNELLKRGVRTLRIFSRDEHKQFLMKEELGFDKRLRFLLGDVRDKERLNKALENIDIVFHCAALKHVESSEYNPYEAVKTNVIGIQNAIECSIENDVERFIYTSSDKAANPNNTMGATKLLGERLTTAANYSKGSSKILLASVRFGNVIGSRGSVIPLFEHQIREKGYITITDPEMTRFMMSQVQASQLLLKCAEIMRGGEIFILKMPVVRLKDIAEVLIDEFSKKYNFKPSSIRVNKLGAKPGETEYEELMTEHEAERIIEKQDMYIIPSHLEMYNKAYSPYKEKIEAVNIRDSRSNKVLSKGEIAKMLRDAKIV